MNELRSEVPVTRIAQHTDSKSLQLNCFEMKKDVRDSSSSDGFEDLSSV